MQLTTDPNDLDYFTRSGHNFITACVDVMIACGFDCDEALSDAYVAVSCVENGLKFEEIVEITDNLECKNIRIA